MFGATAITSSTANRLASTATPDVLDNILFTLGTSKDIAQLLRTATLTANTALTNVLIGTPVTPALAANSLIVSNVTADGDMLFAVNDGGHSQGLIWLDGDTATLNFPLGATSGGDVTMADAKNIILNTTTGTKIGTATNQKLGFFNVAPVIQASHIANSAGDDATAVNAILVVLENLGLTASA